MFTTVPGVAAAPPASGLVAAAARPDPASLPHWEQGLAWVPERCGTAYQLLPWCGADPVGYTPPRPGIGYHQPVELRVADECTTMSGPVDQERVRRVADAQFPFAVARELWGGALAATAGFTVGGDDLTNSYLASSDAEVVGNGPAAALVALGRLEHAAMEATHGQPVMLHVPLVASWLLAGSLFRVGGSLLTAAGNVVVADGGYLGTGPAGQDAGSSVWAYATSPVAVIASPWVIDTDNTTVDHRTNTRTTWASRLFAALYDPCAHLATEIDLTN